MKHWNAEHIRLSTFLNIQMSAFRHSSPHTSRRLFNRMHLFLFSSPVYLDTKKLRSTEEEWATPGVGQPEHPAIKNLFTFTKGSFTRMGCIVTSGAIHTNTCNTDVWQGRYNWMSYKKLSLRQLLCELTIIKPWRAIYPMRKWLWQYYCEHSH